MWVIYTVILQTNICDTSNCSGFAGMSIYDIGVIFLYQSSYLFNRLQVVAANGSGHFDLFKRIHQISVIFFMEIL